MYFLREISALRVRPKVGKRRPLFESSWRIGCTARQSLLEVDGDCAKGTSYRCAFTFRSRVDMIMVSPRSFPLDLRPYYRMFFSSPTGEDGEVFAAC